MRRKGWEKVREKREGNVRGKGPEMREKMGWKREVKKGGKREG